MGEIRSMTSGEEMLPRGYSGLLLVVTGLVIKCLSSPTTKPQIQQQTRDRKIMPGPDYIGKASQNSH